MADTLRYLDPVNDPYWRQQEFGVEPPNPYTKYLVGAGIAALGIALARTPVGQRGFRVLSRFLHGSAQTELERLVIGRFYRARQLSEFLAAEGVASSRRAQVIGAHMKRLDDWIVERQINRARFDIGRLLGLRPLTVGDVLDNPKAFSFEAWYETSRYGGRSDPQRFMRALRELVDRNAEARRMQVSPGLYVNRFGDVIDLRGPGEWLHRALSGLEEIRVPIVGFQPLKIFRYSEIREARRQIPFHIYDVGSFQPILSELGENVAERRLRRPTVWIGESLYDLLDPDRGPLATGVYGLSFGTLPRIMATMLGIDPEQIATTKAARRRWLARVLDVGAQRQRSVWGQIRDFLGKRKDPYEPINLFNMAVRSVQEGRPGSAVAPWKLLIDQFRDEAMPLDAASFGRILAEIRRTQPGAKFLDDLFPKGLKFDTERDLAQALRRLAVTSKPGAKVVGTQVRDLYFRTYLRDPESFWKTKHFKARRPFVIGSYDLVSVSGEITQQERVTSLIQREILARAVEQNVIDLDRLLSLQLGGTQGKRLRQLLALNEMERAISTGSVRLESLSDAARNLIEQEARTLYPWYTVKSVEFSPTRELLRMSGGPVLIHRAFRPPSPIEILRAFNDAQRRQAVFKQTRDFLLQFTAGREDLEHFSTLTSLLYYTANRLNEMAARYGLGLSPASLGSAHQILSSLIFKRYVPALLGLGLGSYAAWEFENLTGIDLKTEFANTLAGFGLMAASFFEKTGITAAAKWAEDVLPGSELFWEMPVTSFFDARKTREEYEEFLREGRQPMRKGRWWQFSNCVHPDTEIQVGFGLTKRARDVRPGDYVLTVSGRLRRVLQTVSRTMSSEEKMYELIPHRVNWGPAFKTLVTDNHPLLVLRPEPCLFAPTYEYCRPDRNAVVPCLSKCSTGPQPLHLQWVEARDVEPGDYLAYPVRHIRPSIDTLDGIPLDRELGYFLGLYFAEGNFHKRVNGVPYSLDLAVDQDEEPLIERINSAIERVWPGKRFVPNRNRLKHQDTVALNYICNSVEIATFVDNFMYLDGEKYIPDLFFQAPVEFARGFIEGLFDGDGWVVLRGKNSVAFGFSTVRPQAALQVWNLLLAFGVLASVTYSETETSFGRCENYILQITGADALRFLDEFSLYDMRKIGREYSRPAAIGRKHAVLTEDFLLLELKDKVEIDYVDVVYDFEIEDDHSFAGVFCILHNTPYQGGRIQYFAPNWYQRMVSDYEWTPEGLGSKEEYFANAWFPTPRYPLAPLRYFVTDPYRWEREHYYTRPYPETGGFAIFEDIPLVGPALNQTIGRLFKPKRRMHEEELAAYIARRVQEAQETGEGSSVIVAPVGPGTGGALGVAIAADQNEAVRQEAAIQEQPVYTVQVTPAGMIRVYKGISPGTSIARAQNVAVRSGLKLRSQVRPYELAGLTYQEPEPPVEEIVSTSDPVQAITAMQYQLSEMGGLYGWLMRSATPMGMAMERRRLRPRWQTPQMRATSIGRTFEDLNIGGFPGDLSELARRFIPNLPYYDEYREVNPIPNLMPSWMPGEDYFINFQQGDPYIKVPLGEARLPGGGFARLNREDVLRSWANAPMDLKQAILRGEVSPYEFYDVYTRFKILADVAPYSSQYRYYADLLTKNKELIPEGRYEEFQRIKREVSAVKKRLRVFPYKFKDAQLIKEQVTIARILDNNTFLTLEYPDNPIRLAGIYVPSGRNDKLAQAAGFYIHSQLMPGTTVTIGYTADPLKKFSDDTLRTIRAVVWVDGVNLNRELLELGYAREKDDDSPAGIHARYSPVEIAVGSLWERFAHMDTPIHCVAPWTEVITSDGVVAAGDLKPGAYVLTHTGHYKKVVDVRPQPAGKRVVEVKLSSSNIPLVVTDDHPILACRHVRKKRVTSRSRGVKLEPWDRNVIQRQRYEVANRVLELLVAGWNGTKEQMARELGVSRSYLARVMDMLAADGKIRRGNNRRALPVVVNPERYDTSPGPKLEFIHAGDLRPYDYVVYRPREMPESTPPLIDLAALNPDRFAVIGDEVTTTLHGGAPRTNGTKLPRFLPVTTELARLMGYYAAKGCIGNNASNYAQIVSFVFNRSETRYADDVANLLRRVFGKEPRVVVGDTTIRVELSLAFAAELLKHYVGEKEQKRVPEELLTTRDLRAEFIRGLLRGDGLKASRTVPYSELGMVALNILLWVRDALFHLWRIPAAIALGIVRNHPLYVLRIGSYPQLVEFVDGEGPCPNGPFERDVESRTSAAVGEFIFYRVESVSESEYQGGTIDIEVEGDDTFATLNADVHNTKFLQVRSPLEMYWREDLYGKRWRPWNLKDQIVPTLESWAAKPVWQAALYGAAYGTLIFGATRWRRGGIIGGALFAGGLSFARWVYEQISGQVWVPARRRLEWDIWEYMDYLTYVKYKALYEATLREAEARGLEEVTWFFEQVEQRRRRTRWERQRLMEEKRRLTLEDKEGNRERIREINARLREISEDILTVEDPHPLLLQAIAYRQMYESTLYGADPYGDMTSIMRALPPNIRDYFMYFVEAGPEERELIRGRVPRGVERLLRARWGEEPGELPTPEEYFREHYLPPAHWEGWMPGKDLRDIKVQIVRHSGIDPTELGVWDSDVRTAEEHQAPLLPWNQPNTEIDLQEQLRLLLEGEGLRDVIVRVERSRNLGITVGFDVEVDRQAEIDMAILHELENILR